MKRVTLALLFSIASLSPAALPLAAQSTQSLQIKTDKGKVEGAITADGQVRAFKGIPYAAPPVGELRWQPPQPAARWSGVRGAMDFGAHCMQPHVYSDMVFHDPGGSEDCLTLNVWTPVDAKPGSLPVMVWVYGGGFAAGGTSEARQDGQFLAHRNVVVVSMNYRLGIFGFFVHPELTAESPHHASGNYGLLDQAAALAWVKKNIGKFGGDPHNITIFGESAGSFAVSALMASPLTKDDMRRAIGESGGAFFSGGLTFNSRGAREQADAKFAQDAFGTSKLADLRALPAQKLMEAARSDVARKDHAHFGPDVDGWFLPEPVPDIYAAGKQAHIPLLAGWNADEDRDAALFAKVPVTAESFRAQAQAEFGARAADFLKLYPASTDAEALQSAGDLAGDRFIEYSTWRWIEAQVKTGDAPVYRYRLDLGSPGDANHAAALGAFHSDDIEYVFGTLDSRPAAQWRPQDRALSNQIGEYWTNFARTGDPNGGSLPQWPLYSTAGGWQVMHLDATSMAQPDTHRARYLFLDEVWGKPKGQGALSAR
jgi:para-nitrobenzyl esterase